MTGLGFTVSCLHCGQHCDLLAQSTACGTTSKAMVKCSGCCREYLIRAVIEPVVRPESLRRRELREAAA